MTNRNQQLIRGAINLRPEHHGSVVTIGAFDGLHLGHQAILRDVQAQAKKRGLPSTVVIFEPLPREFFQPSASVARLMPFREKVQALFHHGIDQILVLAFNRRFASLTAEAFVEQILIQGLGVQHLVIGDDFRFGKNRTGDFALLSDYAQRHGFSLASSTTIELGNDRVSSTRIRELLANGEFTEVEACLGRPFSIGGKVIRGKQMGRQLGVPTANIALKRMTSPLLGAFAGEVLLAQRFGDFSKNATAMPAVVNIGVRPTVNALLKPILEAHLLDFSSDLYGQRVTVTFRKKIRDEKKFDSLNALKQRIQQDIDEARQFFDLQ